MTWKQYPGSRNSICGDKNTDANFVEDIADIDIVVPHDQKDLLIQIGAILDQAPADESWGVRDYKLYL